MRKNGAGARDIFFRFHRVDFIFDLVAFGGDGVEANAMDGACGGAKFWNENTKLVPSRVREIKKGE